MQAIITILIIILIINFWDSIENMIKRWDSRFQNSEWIKKISINDENLKIKKKLEWNIFWNVFLAIFLWIMFIFKIIYKSITFLWSPWNYIIRYAPYLLYLNLYFKLFWPERYILIFLWISYFISYWATNFYSDEDDDYQEKMDKINWIFFAIISWCFLLLVILRWLNNLTWFWLPERHSNLIESIWWFFHKAENMLIEEMSWS